MGNKAIRAIVVMCVCILCVPAIGHAIRFFTGDGAKGQTDGQLDGQLDGQTNGQLDGQLGGHISAGDAVTVEVSADELDGVYGYQFELNYDKGCLGYANILRSDIDGIDTIFAAEKERRLLVGATMVGDSEGFVGREAIVCRVGFVALSDCDPHMVSLSNVNVVTDDMRYLENVGGWTASISGNAID